MRIETRLSIRGSPLLYTIGTVSTFGKAPEFRRLACIFPFKSFSPLSYPHRRPWLSTLHHPTLPAHLWRCTLHDLLLPRGLTLSTTLTMPIISLLHAQPVLSFPQLEFYMSSGTPPKRESTASPSVFAFISIPTLPTRCMFVSSLVRKPLPPKFANFPESHTVVGNWTLPPHLLTENKTLPQKFSFPCKP